MSPRVSVCVLTQRENENEIFIEIYINRYNITKKLFFFSMNYNDNQTTNGLIWKNKKNDETTWGLCLKSSSEIPFDLI